MSLENAFYVHLKENDYKISLNLGEFVLSKKTLGQGGNGLVFEAKILDKTVAIKFLLTEATGSIKQKK